MTTNRNFVCLLTRNSVIIYTFQNHNFFPKFWFFIWIVRMNSQRSSFLFNFNVRIFRTLFNIYIYVDKLLYHQNKIVSHLKTTFSWMLIANKCYPTVIRSLIKWKKNVNIKCFLEKSNFLNRLRFFSW